MRRPRLLRTFRSVRRRRRGLAALSAAVAVAGAAALAVTALQIREGRARLEGRAFLVADVAAADGRALHRWLHGEQDSPAFAAPAEGASRRLTPAETSGLEAHASFSGWRALPRGWTSVRLAAVPAGQGADPRAFGILVLRPGADVTDAQRDAALSRLGEAADGTAAVLAGAATGLAFDPARDIAVHVHPFAQLDTEMILREPRSGHPAGTVFTETGTP